MRLTEDKEMDLLLGRFARRERVDERPANVSSGSAAHMDADELNAYAENALSPAARARYAAHLADCDDCRRSVTSLVLATGAASVQEKRTEPVVQKERGWWQSLSTLFSLPVIRYGVPALAIAAIVSIVFFATRRSQQPEGVFVAENRERAPVSAVSQPEENHAQTSSTMTTGEASSAKPQDGAFTDAANANSTSGQNPGALKERGGKSDAVAAQSGPLGEAQQPLADARVAQNLPAPKPAAPALSTPSDSLSRTETAKKAEEVIVAAPTSGGTQVAASPDPQQNMDAPPNEIQNVAGAAARASAQRQARAAREMSRGRDMTLEENSNGAGQDNNYTVDDGKAKTMSKHAPTPQPSARRRQGAREDKDEISDKERRGEGEKRSVSGRTFRRQGSAWIDTAYNSSRATVNVSRGSEQYRALTADEPGLRTVAEQLGGEVIVVWKGRAYRIH